MRKTPPFMRSFHFVFIIALIISVLIRCGFAAGSAPISADLTETFASLPIRAPLCKKSTEPRLFYQPFASSPFLEELRAALEPCDPKKPPFWG